MLTLRSKRPPFWTSEAILSGLEQTPLVFPADILAQMRPELLGDMRAESHATRLASYLREREDLQNCQGLSQFLAEWEQDERNHARGFCRIVSCLYQLSEVEIEEKLPKPQPRFDLIDSLLPDAQTVVAAFFYDEWLTTIAYKADLEFYRLSGEPRLPLWIRKVAQDESYHFRASVELFRHNYPSSTHDIGNIVTDFICYDLDSGTEYPGVFFFDHKGLRFTPKVFDKCREVLLRIFKS